LLGGRPFPSLNFSPFVFGTFLWHGFPKVTWFAPRHNNHVGGFRKFDNSAIVAMPGVLLHFKLVEIFVDSANVFSGSP
jgi:hypothetical protein